jgi:hypothetical protein
LDERAWLYQLNTGTSTETGPLTGPYHLFKERLKP